MPNLTRVATLNDNGDDVAYTTVDLDGLTDDERTTLRILSDDEDNAALDRYGRPRDTTYPTGPAVDGEPVLGYDALSVAQLRDEITSRNAGRADDDHVVVEPPGNKADLVAALEADDQAGD